MLEKCHTKIECPQTSSLYAGVGHSQFSVRAKKNKIRTRDQLTYQGSALHEQMMVEIST